MGSRAVAVAFAAVCGIVSPPAFACAVCATSDATIAPGDSERPFRSRLQGIADFRAGSVEEGGVTVADRRLELSASYAPNDDLLLTLGVPALTREISSSAGDVARTSLGDVELRLRVVRARTLAGGARERFGVLVELKLPTAPEEFDAAGAPLASTLQPGCSALVPAAGLDYAIAKGKWSGYGGVSLWLPFSVRAAPHAGDSLRAGARLQWQPIHALAVRAGPSFQLDTAGELANGADDPNSGGVIGYAAGELAFTPATDLVVSVGALYPALQVLRGDHHEGAIASATVSYDF
ncbi:MAG: hypothetical protein ACLQVI_34870 [Polyangiaceae bacterium]|jgi:hypothetical protein